MFDFPRWLKQQRKEKKMSQRELAEWINRQTGPGKLVDFHTISNWERGISSPDNFQFLYLGLWAGVDPYVTFLGRGPYNLNEEGLQRLNAYAGEYARLLEQTRQYLPEAETAAPRMLRYYDIPVSAGSGQFLDSDRFELRPVDNSVPAGADYSVRVAGDSMEPRFVDKQWVYVRRQETLADGEIGIFYYDGESYCKVLARGEGGLRLVSLNPAYAPIPVRLADSFRVLGKVVG